MTSKFTIHTYPFESPLARQLVTECADEINELYSDLGPEPNGLYVPDSTTTNAQAGVLQEGQRDETGSKEKQEVIFLLASMRESPYEAAGCLALKVFDASTPPQRINKGTKAVEFKRLYVRPAYRRQGLAEILMSAGEFEAKAGLHGDIMLLETGTRQLPAIRLYKRLNWKQREMYGSYVSEEDGDVSICFEKVVTNQEDRI